MLKIKKNMDTKWITILISIMPLLDAYELESAPISLGEIGLIVAAIYTVTYFIVNRRKIIISNKNYLFFLLYSFISSLIISGMNDYFRLSEWFFKWGRILLYSYAFLTMAYIFIDIDLLANCFCKIGLITSIFQIIQFMSWKIFHKAIFLLIPILKLHYVTTDYNLYVQNLMRWNGSGWRPSNFFLEPAQYGIYASFALVVALFYLKKYKITIAVLISTGIVVSGSAIAIILVGIIWGLWVFIHRNYMDNKVFFITNAVVIVMVVFLFTDNVIKEKLLYRIHTIGQLGASTGSLRLLRGFHVFRQLNFVQKIFGIGMGNLQNFLISSSITTVFDTGLEIGNEYMNSLSYILNNTGLIGIIIFGTFAINIFINNKNKISRVFWIVWLIIVSVTSNFLTSFYVIPLIFIISISTNFENTSNK